MTRFLSLALVGAFTSMAHCLALRGSSIIHLDCWQFDAGKALLMEHRSRTVMLFYGSKLKHEAFSITALTIPQHSIPPFGFKELLEGYQLDMGPSLRLKVDSMTRRDSVEMLQFHVDVVDRRKRMRRMITDLWRYRWHLLEVDYEFTTNPSFVQNEAHLFHSVTLAKPASRVAYGLRPHLHRADT